MDTYKLLFGLLCAEQELRPQRQAPTPDPVDGRTVPEWVLLERRAMLGKVNELRASVGLGPIDETTLVKKAEWLACGHCDYSTKYSLYAAALADETTGAVV
jgi:hypothetical protein